MKNFIHIILQILVQEQVLSPEESEKVFRELERRAI